MSGVTTITLPPGLDTGGAGTLAQRLSELRGKPVALDAAGVGRVGALGLQVLLSARLTWARDGERMSLERPSEALAAAFERAGVQIEFDRS